MVIGDPYKFAIIIDIVDEWSSNGFTSGMFYISIDGCLFPKALVNTTLNSELYVFFESAKSSLLTNPMNIELFDEKKTTAYSKLYNFTYPEFNDDSAGDYPENNYLYSCGFSEIEGAGCFLFSVSNGEEIRILGREIINNDFTDPDSLELEQSIHEVFMPITELESMVRKLRGFYDEFITSNRTKLI